MRQETFPIARFESKAKMWAHLETRINAVNRCVAPVQVVHTMRDLIDRYQREYLSELSKGTRDTDGSMLRLHIKPRWGHLLISDVKAGDVELWCKSLPMVASTKGRAKRLLKQLIDRAMVWEMLPFGQNPITFVKIRGVSLRQKEIVILPLESVRCLIATLPDPYSLMVLLAAGLGLRSEEMIALRWEDFNFQQRTVRITRAFSHGEVKETKTSSSSALLPIDESHINALLSHRKEEHKTGWLFPSPTTVKPLRPDMVLRSHIHPVMHRIGITKVGWHSLRHSYKAWQGSGDATLSELKDLMRHSTMLTTTDLYGGTPVEALRPHVSAIAARLTQHVPIQ